MILFAAGGNPLKGRYPEEAVDTAISSLEAVRPDYPEGGVIRAMIDDALDGLYRFRAVETGKEHPYPRAGDAA